MGPMGPAIGIWAPRAPYGPGPITKIMIGVKTRMTLGENQNEFGWRPE